jgi:hypothetical protein
MRRSTGRSLAVSINMIASGAALIRVIPAALGADPDVAAWLPIALGALFAASAIAASRVRPAIDRPTGGGADPSP